MNNPLSTLPIVKSARAEIAVRPHDMDHGVGMKRIDYVLERGERIGVIDNAVVYATKRYSLALFDDGAFLYDKYNLVLHSITL